VGAVGAAGAVAVGAMGAATVGAVLRSCRSCGSCGSCSCRNCRSCSCIFIAGMSVKRVFWYNITSAVLRIYMPGTVVRSKFLARHPPVDSGRLRSVKTQTNQGSTAVFL
jgi:hypothetical protein